MGAYLSTPVTDKNAFEGHVEGLMYGGASMQGWRRSMEDAHFANPSIGEIDVGISAFGVFDGHGGCEVAKLCEKYLPEELQKMEGFPNDIEIALINVFHRMDEMLRDTKYQAELESFRTKNENENKTPDQDIKDDDEEKIEDEDDEEEVAKDQSKDESGPSSNTSTSTTRPDSVMKQLDLMRRFFGPHPSTNNANNAASKNTDQRDKNSDKSSPNENKDDEEGMVSADDYVQSGSTAVVAVKKGNMLYVANAGDSRAVICKGSQAVALSEDHKPILEKERARIEAAGGFLSEIAGMYRVNGNLNLSRAIGDLKYKINKKIERNEQIITAEPEVKKLEITEEYKFFVLACDGVWDVMSNQEVIDFVMDKLDKGEKISEISKELLDKCLATDPRLTRGVGCDNMTVLIVSFMKPVPSSHPIITDGKTEEDSTKITMKKVHLDEDIKLKVEDESEKKGSENVDNKKTQQQLDEEVNLIQAEEGAGKKEEVNVAM